MSLAVRMDALDRTISDLDPLEFVRHVDHLTELNAHADRAGLERLADDMLARVWNNVSDLPTAGAALRDLGFVLASLERHGVDHRTLSGAEETLLKLGDITDEIPRDSVYTYALRNPRSGTRFFTGIPEEILFIDQVRIAGTALRPAVDDLVATLTLPLRDPELTERLARAVAAFRTFAEALLAVKRQVTPEVFSHQMRPYFPPMTVGGTVLYAPGGAQMTPLLVDIALLRPEPGEPEAGWYPRYLDENLPYLPAAYREAADAIQRHRPLLPRLLDEAARAGSAPRDAEREEPALRQLRLLMREVLRFRLPHLQLARANMAIRVAGSLGSGGYTTSSLDQLAELTTRRHHQLTDALSDGPPAVRSTAPPTPQAG
ncbi:monodechloroaminopyrrolnitrin synthase PrnB family protein [Streptomyces liangshanensis]|uniref:monodechloroaminopyrrolnitrin synthase PrnB family protein n=1 Tax=Streptomyces liangshanensis TaxID=2717324 RepID=UPI0036DEFAC6